MQKNGWKCQGERLTWVVEEGEFFVSGFDFRGGGGGGEGEDVVRIYGVRRSVWNDRRFRRHDCYWERDVT